MNIGDYVIHTESGTAGIVVQDAGETATFRYAVSFDGLVSFCRADEIILAGFRREKPEMSDQWKSEGRCEFCGDLLPISIWGLGECPKHSKPKPEVKW